MDGPSIEAVSDYIAKITHEITSPTTKVGREGNRSPEGTVGPRRSGTASPSRSPFAILRDALETGLLDDLQLWWTWEKVSHGRQQVTWSKDLRTWAGLHRERDDDEIVKDDQHGESAVILPKPTWVAIRSEVSDLLDTVELHGIAGAIRWLRSRGLTYLLPGTESPPRRLLECD